VRDAHPTGLEGWRGGEAPRFKWPRDSAPGRAHARVGYLNGYKTVIDAKKSKKYFLIQFVERFFASV